MISLQGKKAIVTGGAGGIGLAGVRLFRAAGADVIIADIDENAGRRAADETGATFVRCDVSNSNDVQRVVAAADGCLYIERIVAAVDGESRAFGIASVRNGSRDR